MLKGVNMKITLEINKEQGYTTLDIPNDRLKEDELFIAINAFLTVYAEGHKKSGATMNQIRSYTFLMMAQQLNVIEQQLFYKETGVDNAK